MRVHVEDRWEADAVDVYVIDGRPANRILRLAPPPAADAATFTGADTWEPLEPNAAVAGLAPTFRVRRAVWDAIVAAGAELAPADRTMDTAWRDARDTRDRLLGLVERLTAPAPTPDAPVRASPR
jgi:hypothetical protein